MKNLKLLSNAKVQISAFEWRGQPSISGNALMLGRGRKKTAPLKIVVFGSRNSTASIATEQPVKRRPGVGKSATI